MLRRKSEVDGRAPAVRRMQPRAAMWAALLLGAGSVLLAADNALTDLPRHAVISERLHASGQPSAAQIARLPSAGITTLIDLRPQQETPDMDEATLAREAGLKYRVLPISGAADLTHENVLQFDRLLGESDAGRENVLMYCASSNRVGALMALRARWVQGRSVEEAMAIGRAAGMTGLGAEVQKLLEARVPQASP